MFEFKEIATQLLKRELCIYMRHKSEILTVLLFFVLIVTLFPVAFGPLPRELNWLIPGIIWIAALLASLLAQEHSIRSDYHLGIFEQLLLSDCSFSLILLVKSFANWLVTGLPLVLITPLLALSFTLPNHTIIVLTASMLLGTPLLSLITTLGVALTITLPRGGVLLAVLTLPLYMPALVLGTAASILTLQGLDSSGPLALLAAMTVAAILLVPIALSTLLKVSVT